MTELESNIFVFIVLPLIFLSVWTYAFLYNRRLRLRMHEMEGPNGHLDSVEAGILAAMQRPAKPAHTR
ncbi:MAG: hypothetical protein PW789_03435 [Edaphobacter sp.]|uniref:hypothetical protein n=1 Tax=Edaphobacter sp. TaxID=1934404 RepID=UPI0023A1DB9D|nr:hypothetical protein [Edaphobacter sp.]MDE1175638.1 hypothetical protein [Edaphobacter sp.]